MRKTEILSELSAEEVAQIPAIRDEWLKIGLSTEPMNRDAARAAICAAYKAANLAEPEIFIFLGSPWAGAVGAAFLTNMPAQVGDQVRSQVGAQVWDQVWDQVGAQVRSQVGAQVWDQVWDQVGAQVRDQVGAQVGDQVGDQVWDQVGAQVRAQVRAQVGAQVRDQVWDQVWKAVYGSHEAGWMSFYDFFRRSIRNRAISGPERLTPLMEAAQNAGWWWPFAGAVIVTDRPSHLQRDAQNRLHREDGPALAYRDGWSIYAWHGMRIPAEFIERRDEITVDRIKGETNAEHRRVLVDLFGRERYLIETGAKEVHRDEHGILWRADDGGDEPLMFVEVENATIEHGERRRFQLRVPPTMRTAHEAVAWTFYETPATYKLSAAA